MSNEWYLQEYKNKDYLRDRILMSRLFDDTNGQHNHCELCWARFSNHPTDLHSGYYEEKSKSWICADCYNEAAEIFGWKIQKST